MIRSGRWLLIFWLISPFAILLYNAPTSGAIDGVEFWWAFKNTFWQALGSATVSLVLGTGGLFLVFWVQNKFGRQARLVLEGFLLLPSLLPPLFILLALLRVIHPFPFGVLGIIVIHSFMNAGLCAVALARLLQSSNRSLMDLCWVEGCGVFRFLRVSLLGYLRASVGALFLLVFSLAFTSFAVPLIIAGDRGTTLEVLIYEKIRIEGDLASALSLSFIQTAIIFALSLLLRKRVAASPSSDSSSPFLASLWPGLPVFFMSALIVVSCASGWFSGWKRLNDLPDLRDTIAPALLGSLGVGFTTGLLCFFLLQLILFLSPSRLLQRFILGYVAPSTVIAGFAYLLITPGDLWVGYVRLVVVLALLFLPTLYRLAWHHQIEALRGQLSVAHTLGASSWQRFWYVSFPQNSKVAGWLSGIAAFWAVGDFALSRILLGREATLALVVDSLMTFYRLDLAMSLSSLLLVMGLILALFFGGLGYVGSRKTFS